MLRKIIHIDQAACNGCGACAAACHEGAIGMVDGKAKLLRDDYCDGLGDCLPSCPTGAITIVEREAAAYEATPSKNPESASSGGCPGSRIRQMRPGVRPFFAEDSLRESPAASRLAQWPVQIQLVPVRAPFFQGADLLIAADCAAYACGDFHTRWMQNRITLIGCPKLDVVDYAEKLAEILRQNDIRSLTVVRMEVPCCGELERAAGAALKASGKQIPYWVEILGIDGQRPGI